MRAEPRKVTGSRKALDHVDHLVTAVALEATELDQFTDSLHNDARLTCTGHRDTPTSLDGKKTLVPKDVKGS